MFTFQPLELLLVLFAGAALFVGLSFFILRRRDEILQDFLTPDEPEFEQEFFKRKPFLEEILPEEEPVPESEPVVEKEEKPSNVPGWGADANKSEPSNSVPPNSEESNSEPPH